MPSVILDRDTPEVKDALAAADGNDPDAAFVRHAASINGEPWRMKALLAVA